jgi:hypothetical protein
MPLCALLWIIVLLPIILGAWMAFCCLTEADDEPSLFVALAIVTLLVILTPQLLWYQSVRNVMFPDAPTTLQAEKNIVSNQ